VSLREPTKAEIALQCMLVLYLAIMVNEYISGLSAPACPAQDCYAWGTENFLALGWEYESSAIYLRATFLRIMFGLIAIAIPFITPSVWLSFPIIIAVFLCEFAYHRDLAVSGAFPTPH
jgi:hypothetical protein